MPVGGGFLGLFRGLSAGSRHLGGCFGRGIVGGVANPIYSVLLAYTNDFLDASDMPLPPRPGFCSSTASAP